jgi:hypothetical protein
MPVAAEPVKKRGQPLRVSKASATNPGQRSVGHRVELSAQASADPMHVGWPADDQQSDL